MYNNSLISNDYERKNSPRKKKRKYSIESGNSSSNIVSNSTSKTTQNLSINIIDRVLDLSKYKKNIGLYELSRNWINATTSINNNKNNNNNDNLVNKSSINLMQQDSSYVKSLPDPDCSIIINNEKAKIQELNENIKLNIRSSEASDIELINSLSIKPDDYLIQTHALLKLHVNRFKAARKEWLNYYKKTNDAYKNSRDILKSIYEDS